MVLDFRGAVPSEAVPSREFMCVRKVLFVGRVTFLEICFIFTWSWVFSASKSRSEAKKKKIIPTFRRVWWF